MSISGSKIKQTVLKKWLKYILISLGILLVLSIAGISVGYYIVFYPNTSVSDNGIIYIGKNSQATEVLDSLQIKGYIRNNSTLRYVARLKKYTGTIKSGRFRIRNGINNNELVNLLRAGTQEPIQFTFNNIRTLDEFAETLSRQLPLNASEFLARIADPEVLDQLGFSRQTIVSMFIPNTYELYWDISMDDFINRMNREYQRFWNEERMRKATAIGLTPIEVVTLASIIEEETAKREEYPIIAGVYINRLQRGMKLDADPTLKFAAGDFSLARLLDKHKKIDSPYNTYMYAGLPPGPIRIASIQVVEGVLNYQKHDYLFFCAKSDFSGYHSFSKTLRQHNIYAKEYQRELNRRRIW